MTQQSRVVVIGGGFAGLKAAVSLADAALQVTVLESRVGLGGRARSFQDPVTGEVVDNGQHLFLTAYRETLEFLNRLGTQESLVFQDRLRVDFVQPGGGTFRLSCPAIPSPWHLLVGMARLPSLSLRDKLGLLRIFQVVTGHETKAGTGRSEAGSGPELVEGPVPASDLVLDQQTVEEWLTRMGQSQRSRTTFWDPLTVATLNELPSRASVLGLVTVLRTMLRRPWRDSCLGVSSVGLTDLYAASAQKILLEKGGQVMVNSPAAGLELRGDRVTGVRLVNGTILSADWVISAVGPQALVRILPQALRSADPSLQALDRFQTSPILSVNLWLDRPVTEALFIGLIGTRMQWLFNKPAIPRQAGITANYLSLIVSAAHDLLGESNERLVEMAMEDLRACFPTAAAAAIIRSQVVRERDATVSLTVGTNGWRPGQRTRIPNLFLAGDWTATGLPATIESAVLSGRLCAEALLKGLA